MNIEKYYINWVNIDFIKINIDYFFLFVVISFKIFRCDYVMWSNFKKQ